MSNTKWHLRAFCTRCGYHEAAHFGTLKNTMAGGYRGVCPDCGAHVSPPNFYIVPMRFVAYPRRLLDPMTWFGWSGYWLIKIGLEERPLAVIMESLRGGTDRPAVVLGR